MRLLPPSRLDSTNPALAVKPSKVDGKPTLPFSPEEMERILAACDKYPGRKTL